MLEHSVNAPQQKPNAISEWVWYDGSGALLEGQGVCYEYNFESPASPANLNGDTTATADGRRTNLVVLPGGTGIKGTQSAGTQGGRFFAGVCAANYPASAYGQLIEIYRPGSTCYILSAKSLTLGVGRVTCQFGGAQAGYFSAEGFSGQGSAIPLQTLDGSSTPVKTLARLEEGAQSGLVDFVGGGAFAGGAVVPNLSGVTHIPTATNGAAVTYTLANGTYDGQRKRFVIDGTQTTNGFTLTVTTGVKFDGATGITTISSSTAGQETELEYAAGKWYLRSNSMTVA
jgi:hypothetical protein